ncbi:hypothetical protein PR048_016319 [Dryococelus australis]|uniref:Uncharacterized protein n=1 Tax=Dryococelus australis TaxID=614101 RepID=A0ABQ9HJE8_9NEOP|nr:hypothetical protein PR048_016319 [Dryococelus australis]
MRAGGRWWGRGVGPLVPRGLCDPAAPPYTTPLRNHSALRKVVDGVFGKGGGGGVCCCVTCWTLNREISSQPFHQQQPPPCSFPLWGQPVHNIRLPPILIFYLNHHVGCLWTARRPRPAHARTHALDVSPALAVNNRLALRFRPGGGKPPYGNSYWLSLHGAILIRFIRGSQHRLPPLAELITRRHYAWGRSKWRREVEELQNPSTGLAFSSCPHEKGGGLRQRALLYGYWGRGGEGPSCHPYWAGPRPDGSSGPVLAAAPTIFLMESSLVLASVDDISHTRCVFFEGLLSTVRGWLAQGAHVATSSAPTPRTDCSRVAGAGGSCRHVLCPHSSHRLFAGGWRRGLISPRPLAPLLAPGGQKHDQIRARHATSRDRGVLAGVAVICHSSSVFFEGLLSTVRGWLAQGAHVATSSAPTPRTDCSRVAGAGGSCRHVLCPHSSHRLFAGGWRRGLMSPRPLPPLLAPGGQKHDQIRARHATQFSSYFNTFSRQFSAAPEDRSGESWNFFQEREDDKRKEEGNHLAARVIWVLAVCTPFPLPTRPHLLDPEVKKPTCTSFPLPATCQCTLPQAVYDRKMFPIISQDGVICLIAFTLEEASLPPPHTPPYTHHFQSWSGLNPRCQPHPYTPLHPLPECVVLGIKPPVCPRLKTCVIMSLLEHPNGLKCENVCVFSKTIHQEKYQQIATILSLVKGIHLIIDYFIYRKITHVYQNNLNANMIIVFQIDNINLQHIYNEHF